MPLRSVRSSGTLALGWALACRLLLVAGIALVGCRDEDLPTEAATNEPSTRPLLAVVPTNFSDVQLVTGLANPTLMAIAPDGRIFVSEQAGRVRVIKNGVLLGTPFVTLSVNAMGERGALGIAFDPAFTTNHFVYVYYTSSSGPHNRVSRFTASGDVATGGETILLDLPTLSATNHNGGAIHFGPDGKLYVAVGENANGANSQSMSTPLGKLLRINPDGTIPSDNPFFGSTTGINRSIWALGLRNPFTFAFQPGTGRLFINDVGQNTWEEINDGLAGANYGWPTTEGNTTNTAFKSPFYTYDHSNGCAITGGDFYNPATATFPASYVGDYFFADYCSGWIRSIDLATKVVTDFASGISSPTDLQVESNGALYYIERGSGSIRRITYVASGTGPTIVQHPADQTVTVGGAATFTVGASGTPPLSYQWQRNQANISGATAASYTLTNVQPSDNGARFRVLVTNAFGSATSNEAILTVTANRDPVADVTAPAAGTLFRGGQTISYAGDATDPDQGTLPASAFTWHALLFHDDGNPHSHPFDGPVSGSKSGSFTIPTTGETSSNIWYRIYLTVTDAQGATNVDSVDILPTTVSVTLASNPTGLQLTLDGTPVTAPMTFTGVVGIERTVGAVSPQAGGSQTWQFASWSDGGAQSHVISTPAVATTYTATYTAQGTSQIYEAENAILSGAVVASGQPGYTGTGFVRFINAANDYIEWTVTAATAGPKSLDFRYAYGGTTSRSLRFVVNGVIVNSSLVFPPTGGPAQWQILTVQATLNAGTNRVRVRTIGTKGPNLDHLAVR